MCFIELKRLTCVCFTVARKFQPKIKPRPRSNALATASASSSVPSSEDQRNLAPVIPSKPDSLNALPLEVTPHDEPRDSPSSFGKPAAEVKENLRLCLQFQ